MTDCRKTILCPIPSKQLYCFSSIQREKYLTSDCSLQLPPYFMIPGADRSMTIPSNNPFKITVPTTALNISHISTSYITPTMQKYNPAISRKEIHQQRSLETVLLFRSSATLLYFGSPPTVLLFGSPPVFLILSPSNRPNRESFTSSFWIAKCKI